MKKKIAIIILIILVTLPILSILMPIDYSDYLQRPLKSKPKFKISSVVNGNCTKEFEDYLQDRFIFKPEFLSIKAYVNYFSGIREFDNILVKSNILFQKPLKNPRGKIFAKNNKVNIIAIPYKIIYEENLPKSIELKNIKQNILKEYINFSAENFAKILNKNDYYKGDHHLNENGIKKLLEHLNINSDYKMTETYDFRGGLSRKTGMIINDTFKGMYIDEFKNLKANADGKEINVYNFDKLESADPYLFYIGGNYGIVDIVGDGKGNVTIIKDSFANPLLPFFAKKYKNVRAIDGRFLNKKIENHILDGDIYVIGGF